MATLQENSFYIKKVSSSFFLSSGSGQQVVYNSPTASNFLYAIFIFKQVQSSSNSGTPQFLYGVNTALQNITYAHFQLSVSFSVPAFQPPVLNSATYSGFRTSGAGFGYGNYPVMYANESIVTTHAGGGSYSFAYEVLEVYGRN